MSKVTRATIKDILTSSKGSIADRYETKGVSFENDAQVDAFLTLGDTSEILQHIKARASEADKTRIVDILLIHVSKNPMLLLDFFIDSIETSPKSYVAYQTHRAIKAMLSGKDPFKGVF